VHDQLQAEGKAGLKDIMAMFPFTLKATKNDSTWIPYLKSQQFDLLIKGYFPGMDTFTQILEIPRNIMLINTMMDQLIMGGMVGAPYHSTMVSNFEEMLIPLPKDIEEKMDRSSFVTRFKSLLTNFIA